MDSSAAGLRSSTLKVCSWLIDLGSSLRADLLVVPAAGVESLRLLDQRGEAFADFSAQGGFGRASPDRRWCARRTRAGAPP